MKFIDSVDEKCDAHRVDLILGYQSVQCPCLIPCQPQEALSEALVVATLETLVSEQSVRPDR